MIISLQKSRKPGGKVQLDIRWNFWKSLACRNLIAIGGEWQGRYRHKIIL
jgi:hypothetical protein